MTDEEVLNELIPDDEDEYGDEEVKDGAAFRSFTNAAYLLVASASRFW